MIKAGATRIGASAGVKILQGPSSHSSAAGEATAASSAKSY
jgi:deoxyribose-phosphate aldolase